MKVKNTIPVYDICSLKNHKEFQGDIIAEPFGTYLEKHPNLHATHGHSFYHMVLFTKGKGSYTIDFEQYRVSEGQMYFMAPGQVHSWAFEGKTDGYVVNFSESFFHGFLTSDDYLDQFEFLQGSSGSGIIQLSGPLFEQAKEVLNRITKEVNTPNLMAGDMVRALLISLFIIAVRASGKKTKTSDVIRPGLALINNFRNLVNKHYRQYKLPKEYASLLFVTPNHLNAVCREILGQSAGQVIRDRIILEAKRRLVNADVNIAGIGYELGFPDNSYFTKFFKKYAGTTPEVFKNGLTPAI